MTGDRITAVETGLDGAEDDIADLKSALSDNTADISALQTDVANLGTHKVAQPLDEYNQPTDGTNGQSLRTKGDGTTEWADTGLPTDEQTAQAVSDWLDAHPEATTTVQDGSLTEAKFTDALKLKTINSYVTPEMFGAKGDNTTDDSAAIQGMINTVPDQTVCVFNNNYYCANSILITHPINIYMYGNCRFPNTLNYGVRIYQVTQKCYFRLNLLSQGVQDTWKNRNIIGLDLWAVQQCDFDVRVEGFKTGIRLLAGNTEDSAGPVDCDYNRIYPRTIYNCQYAIFMDGLTGSERLNAGVVSQNTFIGGRIGVQGASYAWLGEEDTADNAYWAVRSELKEGRTNNNNTFLGVSFEGFGQCANPYENRAKVSLDMGYGMYLNCRFEGITELSKTKYGFPSTMIIGGYGADGSITNTPYGNFIGARKAVFATDSQPFIFRRNGSGDEWMQIKSPNNIMITKFVGTNFYMPRIALLPNGGYYGSTTPSNSVILLFEYSAENPQAVIDRASARDWRLTNFGHIISKSGNGTAFDIQPIMTSKPNWETIPTGTMIFVNGRPQWYDGSKWVYADGTEAT